MASLSTKLSSAQGFIYQAPNYFVRTKPRRLYATMPNMPAPMVFFYFYLHSMEHFRSKKKWRRPTRLRTQTTRRRKNKKKNRKIREREKERRTENGERRKKRIADDGDACNLKIMKIMKTEKGF